MTTINANKLRAEDVVRMATMGGAKSLGMEDTIGSITAGKKADLLLIKNDQSPAMTPILNPYAHVVYQADTADIHTVVVDGKVVKYDGQRHRPRRRPRSRDTVAASVEYVRGKLGDQWEAGMHPEIPEEIENPYKYTEGDARTPRAGTTRDPAPE